VSQRQVRSVRRPFRAPAALSLLLLAGAAPAPALWSSDPARNLVIADGANDQVQAKIVARADGGCYVSWFDNSTGGYDVRLQRLNADGDEMWPHNGVLVADRGYSSTTDYGLAIDAAGNALLAFRDDSTSPERIVAAKISPTGAHLWGTPGIAVSDSTGYLASPRITPTSDGSVVVAWTQDGDTVLQRLESGGAEQWPHGGFVLPHAGDNFALADLHKAEAGRVIVSWVEDTGFGSDRHLWAQKLDSGASLIWGAGHVQVFDLAGGSLQTANFPPFESDGAGGAVFTWYTSTPTLQVRAQHILADGTEVFVHDGVELSTDTSRYRVEPSGAYDPASGDLYAFWVEENQLQSLFGLYGQRLDSTGARQWTASGEELVPLGGNQLSQVRALYAHDGATVAWVQTAHWDDEPIHATRVLANGSFDWSPALVDVKSSNTGTLRMTAALMSDESAVFAWSDTATNWDVRGQNLHLDGTLGVPPVFADGFESGDTSAWSFVQP
jgi:hypothetical protein